MTYTKSNTAARKSVSFSRVLLLLFVIEKHFCLAAVFEFVFVTTLHLSLTIFNQDSHPSFFLHKLRFWEYLDHPDGTLYYFLLQYRKGNWVLAQQEKAIQFIYGTVTGMKLSFHWVCKTLTISFSILCPKHPPFIWTVKCKQTTAFQPHSGRFSEYLFQP